VPSIFLQVEEDENNENYQIRDWDYRLTSLLRDNRSFSWETKKGKSLMVEEFPAKLYNIKENRVE
jgi:hypothetical protein